MTLTQLEYIVSVATYQSFVAGAEKCFVTQPTLSMQIAKLEDELGVKIFDRNKQPILPTPLGLQIIDQAKTILSEAKKVNELIANSQGKISGEFKLAVIPTIAPTLVPKLLGAFATKYPDVKLIVIEAQTKSVTQMLLDNEVHCGLLSTPLENLKIREFPIFEEQLVCYFGKGEPELEHKLVDIEMLDLKKIWMLNEGNCLRNQVINLCSDHIENLQEGKRYHYESGNVDTLRKMVQHHGGFTILPEMAVHALMEDDVEQVRFFKSPEPVREISLVVNQNFVKTAMLKCLMDEIAEIVPEHMRIQKKSRKLLRIQTSKL